jgi:hypothetical protein
MDFTPISFHARRADLELAEFKEWMARRDYFSESEAVAEVATRPHMACLLGWIVGMPPPDLIKFEFAIKGLFRADLAIGNDKARKFVLVEFEDGRENSLFSGGTRKYRFWSRRLEHGFGQVIDWGWAKHSHPGDVAFTNSFGGRVVDDCYIVVCGRNPLPGSLEEERFDFRRSRLRLSGVTVQILTYDLMVDLMSAYINAMRSW